MKTLLMAALISVSGLALADEATNAPVSGSTLAPASADPLAGLTPEQHKAGEQILASETTRKQAIEENKSLSPQQKQVQLMTLHHNTLIELQALRLTAPAPAPAKP